MKRSIWEDYRLIHLVQNHATLVKAQHVQILYANSDSFFGLSEIDVTD